MPLSQEKQLERQARPDKLAIGGDGGFQLEEDKYEVEKSQALTVLPEGLDVPLPCPDLPEFVLSAIKGVLVNLYSSCQFRSSLAKSCYSQSVQRTKTMIGSACT